MNKKKQIREELSKYLDTKLERSDLHIFNEVVNFIKKDRAEQLRLHVVVEQCKHKYDHYINNHGETVAVCGKCMNSYF